MLVKSLHRAEGGKQRRHTTSNPSIIPLDELIMDVSKQTRKRAVAAGVVIATAMIAGTFSVPVRAAEIDALAPNPTPETSSSSGAPMPSSLSIIAGLLVISIASFLKNAFKHLL